MVSLCQILVGVTLALLVGACAMDTGSSSNGLEDFTAQINENGVITQIPNLSVVDPASEGSIDEKVGCVHIRFCTTPGTSNVITCDTNDQVCSSNARFNECLSDAQIVCGRQVPMAFDPGIPCPITGVCSSGTLIGIF